MNTTNILTTNCTQTLNVFESNAFFIFSFSQSFFVVSWFVFFSQSKNRQIGRPTGLQNCTMANKTSDSFIVDCVEGFDGGLPQTFLLELVETESRRLVRNLSLSVSKNHPNFTIKYYTSVIKTRRRNTTLTEHFLRRIRHFNSLLVCLFVCSFIHFGAFCLSTFPISFTMVIPLPRTWMMIIEFATKS